MGTAKRTRSSYEIASEIASVLEGIALHQGPRALLHPDSKVALNVFGQRGFSVWTGELPEPRAAVRLADLPALAKVQKVFELATAEGMTPELSGQILAALLPPAIDALAIEVWTSFLEIKAKLQQG